MTAWRNVLVPVDLSEGSRQALELALDLQRALHYKIHVVHVADIDAVRQSRADFAPGPPGYRHSVEAFEQHLAADLMSELERWIEPHRRTSLELEVRFGAPAEAIVRLAHDLPADAIFIATHARHGAPHFFLGSITERVVRHASCPVVTVRRGDASPTGDTY